MYQKRKYKHFILLCLVLDLLTMVFLGYRYLDRKIPDEIHIDKNSGLDLSQISNLPFVSFGDTITASREGSYQLPCRLFGKIAFKNIKVKPTEADTILGQRQHSGDLHGNRRSSCDRHRRNPF